MNLFPQVPLVKRTAVCIFACCSKSTVIEWERQIDFWEKVGFVQRTMWGSFEKFNYIPFTFSVMKCTQWASSTQHFLFLKRVSWNKYASSTFSNEFFPCLVKTWKCALCVADIKHEAITGSQDPEQVSIFLSFFFFFFAALSVLSPKQNDRQSESEFYGQKLFLSASLFPFTWGRQEVSCQPHDPLPFIAFIFCSGKWCSAPGAKSCGTGVQWQRLVFSFRGISRLARHGGMRKRPAREWFWRIMTFEGEFLDSAQCWPTFGFNPLTFWENDHLVKNDMIFAERSPNNWSTLSRDISILPTKVATNVVSS